MFSSVSYKTFNFVSLELKVVECVSGRDFRKKNIVPDNIMFFICSCENFSNFLGLSGFFPFLSASFQCFFCGIASDPKLRFASLFKRPS